MFRHRIAPNCSGSNLICEIAGTDSRINAVSSTIRFIGTPLGSLYGRVCQGVNELIRCGQPSPSGRGRAKRGEGRNGLSRILPSPHPLPEREGCPHLNTAHDSSSISPPFSRRGKGWL